MISLGLSNNHLGHPNDLNLPADTMSMLSLASLTRQLGRVTLRNPSFLAASTLPTTTPRAYTTSRRLLSNLKKPSTRAKKQPEIPPQHQEWLAFQESIAVEGFETATGTGSTTKASRKLAEEAAEERQRLTKAGGGLYPPLRYSPEETERLLREAYENIPERAGRRGTRRDKRNFRRWQAVRKIRKKYKKHLVRHHENKMAERSRKIQLVKAELEAAPGL